MFGWGDKGRVQRAVRALVHDAMAPHEVLTPLTDKLRARAVTQALNELLFDDQHDRAVAVADAAWRMGIADVEALLALDAVFCAAGDMARCVEICERASEQAPESGRLVRLLATRLIDADRATDAIELLDAADDPSAAASYERARALVALDRMADALPLLDAVVGYYERQMREMMNRDGWDMFRRHHEDATALQAEARAQLEGPEQVIVAAVAHRTLNAKAGVNYRLLAESLMVESDYRPEHVNLAHPQQVIAALGRHSAHDRVETLVKRGEAQLRLGDVQAARTSFEAACEKDGRHPAGYRGLAAVVDFEQYAVWDQVQALAERQRDQVAPPGIEQVVPDWHALTALEQCVVTLSALPLQRLLPQLIAQGMSIRLLPIDVRTVDLPEWRHSVGERMPQDRRAMDALGGVASDEHGLAASRIEELLNVVTDESLIFAHELSHLAYFVMPDPTPVLALYERALAVPYLASTYQMSNEHEFFAMAYQDYLRQRYGLRTYREPDDQGIWAAVVQMFDTL